MLNIILRIEIIESTIFYRHIFNLSIFQIKVSYIIFHEIRLNEYVPYIRKVNARYREISSASQIFCFYFKQEQTLQPESTYLRKCNFRIIIKYMLDMQVTQKF